MGLKTRFHAIIIQQTQKKINFHCSIHNHNLSSNQIFSTVRNNALKNIILFQKISLRIFFRLCVKAFSLGSTEKRKLAKFTFTIKFMKITFENTYLGYPTFENFSLVSF